MRSLKTASRQLAKLLGTTPDVLYERQRKLVNARLLDAAEGRGPGSGVPATPETVSAVLIALAATETLSEVVERTREIGTAISTRGRCPLTGKRSFREALAVALSSDAGERFRAMTVSRTSVRATIRGIDSTSVFLGKQSAQRRQRRKGLQVYAKIGPVTLRKIQREIASAQEHPTKKLKLRIRIKPKPAR